MAYSQPGIVHVPPIILLIIGLGSVLAFRGAAFAILVIAAIIELWVAGRYHTQIRSQQWEVRQAQRSMDDKGKTALSNTLTRDFTSTTLWPLAYSATIVSLVGIVVDVYWVLLISVGALAYVAYSMYSRATRMRPVDDEAMKDLVEDEH